jgi:OOP family OmpA-OmpF porin
MTVTRFAVLACLLATFAAPTAAQQDLRATLFAEADRALAEARAANAELLAPETFARGAEAYAGAGDDLARGRSMDRIRSALTNAARAFTEAGDAAEIANVTLAAVIKTRADATNANAATFAAELWADASEAFDTAARRLETGDIRGARSRADEAEALYRDAELTAIKAQYLSQTRALLAEAEQARVPRLAPRTYEKALSLLAEAERELSENRYDTDLPRSLAQQANYEARHAIYLASLIGQLREQDQSLEDLILSYASRPRKPRATSRTRARASASSRTRFATSTSGSAACRRNGWRSCSDSKPRRASASNSRRSRTCSRATRHASRAKAIAWSFASWA